MDPHNHRSARERSALRRLEEMLLDLLAQGYPPETIAELMMGQVSSLFAGLNENDCRQIVGHVLEQAALSGAGMGENQRPALRGRPDPADNVIPFPAKRACNG